MRLADTIFRGGNSGIRLADQRRWEAEVAAYIKQHPGASTFDIALECHMGDKPARRFANAVRRSSTA